MNKRETWEKMKSIGADKMYMEIKAAGLNPGIPVIDEPDTNKKVFIKTHMPWTVGGWWNR